MTSFNSLLSSIGVEVQAPQPTPSIARKPSDGKGVDQKPSFARTPATLTPSNSVAGVKRKAEDSERDSRPSSSNSKQDGVKCRASGQAQIPARANTIPRAAASSIRTTGKPAPASAQQKPVARPNAKPSATSNSAASATATSGSPPAKRGFAAMMARAKAVNDAAQAAGPSGIKHKQKQVERVSNRDKQRQLEEQKAQKKAEKRGVRGNLPDRSKSGAPDTGKAAPGKKGPELSYKGTMAKAPEPLKYKGTMQAGTPAGTKAAAKKKSEPEGKYGGYASWSDLDEAEDDEEDGWDSDGSSDMEGGFDDMEQEENVALRAAKKEDQEALEEEERHRREKLERKRKLEALSKSAAAKKRY